MSIDCLPGALPRAGDSASRWGKLKVRRRRKTFPPLDRVWWEGIWGIAWEARRLQRWRRTGLQRRGFALWRMRVRDNSERPAGFSDLSGTGKPTETRIPTRLRHPGLKNRDGPPASSPPIRFAPVVKRTMLLQCRHGRATVTPV